MMTASVKVLPEHEGAMNGSVMLDVNMLSMSVGDGKGAPCSPDYHGTDGFGCALKTICAGRPELDLELARQLQEEENQRRRREETKQEKEEFKKLQVPQTYPVLHDVTLTCFSFVGDSHRTAEDFTCVSSLILPSFS